MFYFFSKGPDYIRCEIRAADSGTWEIVVIEPRGRERVEHHTTSQAAHQRWEELQREFVGDGWFGPYGRE